MYLLICFYLLPALAAILKTRKRKLAQTTTTNDTSSLTTNTSFPVFFKKFLDNFTSNVSSLGAKGSNLAVESNLPRQLQMTALNFETSNDLNSRVLTQTQICNILYS